MVDEVRCHSEFDESEEKVKAQTPLLFVCFHGVLSFCCSLQRQRYGGDLPGFDKEKRFAGRGRGMTCGIYLLFFTVHVYEYQLFPSSTSPENVMVYPSAGTNNGL